MKKILVFLALLACFTPNLTLAAGKAIGETCSGSISGNSECSSGDCEKSSKTDTSGKTQYYCVCNHDKDCTIYGGVEADWSCAGGQDMTWGLHFCINKKNSNDSKLVLEPKNQSFWDYLVNTNSVPNTMKLLDEIKTVKPTPEITIPGVNFNDIKTYQEGNTAYMYIPFLGQYIAAVYKYAISALAVVAIIMIINQGVNWIMSGGEAEKISHAKKRIGEAFIGLALAVGSYTLLYFINPDLVQFKSLKVAYVQGQLLPEYQAAESAANESYPNIAIAVPQLVNGVYSAGLKVPSASSCSQTCRGKRCADQKVRDMAYQAQLQTGYPAAVMIAQYLIEGSTFGSTCSGSFIPSEAKDQNAISQLNCSQYGNCGAGFTWECSKNPKYLPPKAQRDFANGSTIECGTGTRKGQGFVRISGYRCFANPPTEGNIFGLLIKTYERNKCMKSGREQYGGDPVSYAVLLQKCGYATAQDYADTLVSLMNKYCLIGTKSDIGNIPDNQIIDKTESQSEIP